MAYVRKMSRTAVFAPVLLSGELTVKDIAECLSADQSSDAIARTIRQVRNWTDRDLLVPISKGTGKGIARTYNAEPTIFFAAIYYELVRFGATVRLLRFVHHALSAYWYNDGPDTWLRFATTDIDTFLQVSWQDQVPGSDNMEMARIDLIDSADRQYIGDQIAKETISSMLINMNRLLATLDERIPDRLRNKGG